MVPRSRPRSLTAPVRYAVLAATVLAGMASAVAQTITAPTLKAAFLLNFAKFTEWPARDPGLPIRVCVCGSDDVADEMARTVKGQSIDGRAVQVTRISPDGTVSNCQVVFVAEREPRRVAAILEEAGRFPVLTVSDIEQSATHGMMVELFRENGRMRFAVNIDTIERSPVRLSSRLLALARIEHDAPR
jgi:hypothetical protein